MENVSNSTAVDCLQRYSTPPYLAVGAIRAGVGAFSAICCLTVIVVIFVLKKHRDFVQRLVLNVAITALLHSLSYTTARVNYYTDLVLFDPYCYFGGLFNLYSSWVEVLALVCIVHYLFVAELLGRSTHPSIYTQIVFWVGTYCLPLLWCWIPFINLTFGTSSGWCGIRWVDSDCNDFHFGQILQFVIWYIPLYILLTITLIVAVAVTVKVRRDVYRWSGLYDDETKAKRERIRTEITPLLWFPFIYLTLNTFSFIDRLYNTTHPNDPLVELTFFHACTSPLRGAFVALVFLLAGGGIRRTVMMASCRHCCHRDKAVMDYPAERGDDISDSLAHPYKALKTIT